MADKLPKEWLSAIVTEVTKEQKKQKRIAKQQSKDWRLRNTGLLLKNYRKLKIHCDGVVEDLVEYHEMVFDPAGLQLSTLMQYKSKTAKMLKYFDVIFKSYGELSIAGGESFERRYKIIKKLYIDEWGMSGNEVSNYYNVDRSIVTRDTNKAIEELSILLFGIDSFDDLS